MLFDRLKHLNAAAGEPTRKRCGLAERDQLVLLGLVTTAPRRAELLGINWGDVSVDDE
ncbi:MAG: hypothetical protein QOJ29_3346 [Thermoleophilaceae bacterium]|jgi:integrase|nr:hypothetical protein [Thermoleophilaceae bacterium]